MRILIVEDNRAVAETLGSSLREHGFIVDLAFDGEEGLNKARRDNYDLIILDKGLPKKDGLEVCSALRQASRHMPILALSVTIDAPAKTEIINAGADDYMTKPFSFAELLARVRALLRRPKKIDHTIFELNGVVIDIERRFASKRNKPVSLTSKEFSLLEYLIRRRGRTISRMELLEHVWDVNVNPLTNTIETHIMNLRKKLDDRKGRLIRTILNTGYKVDW